MTDTPYEAVMFDLDGTLLDTIEDLAACMNAVMEAEGLPTAPVAEHNFMVGDGVRQYVLRALPAEQRGNNELIELVTRKYRRAYSENWAVRTKPYGGIEQMLTALADKGLRLAVLSNKPDDFTHLMVRHFLGDHSFEIVRGAQPDVPLKPDPSAALDIAKVMDLPSEAFLYVGDTATDMQTARASGFFAVGCAWGFRPRAELEDAGAQAVIAHPSELVAMA